MGVCAPGEPNAPGADTYTRSLVYVIDEKQLTKDYAGKRLVTSGAETRRKAGRGRGKRFSHRRNQLPSKRSGRSVRIEQRTGELQSDQVVTLAVLHAQYLGTQASRDLGQRRQGGQRSAGNLQQNLARGGDGAANCDQHAPRGNIQSGGKLQELFFRLAPAANKNRNGQR
jgi:hypothetical protein